MTRQQDEQDITTKSRQDIINNQAIKSEIWSQCPLVLHHHPPTMGSPITPNAREGTVERTQTHDYHLSPSQLYGAPPSTSFHISHASGRLSVHVRGQPPKPAGLPKKTREGRRSEKSERPLERI